jgi:hypothetical protein
LTSRLFRFRILIALTAALLGFALMALVAPPGGVGFAAPPAQGTCGDGTCDTASGETGVTCPADCLGMCTGGVPDHICKMTGNPKDDPTCMDCQSDNDSICEPGEGITSWDCQGTCGNLVCDPGENSSWCLIESCGACGNGICSAPETTVSCPADCACDGDGICEGTQGENINNCVDDCTTCGDTFCAGSENASTCAADCPTACGDTVCTGSESASNCASDCAAVCGDSSCTHAENASTCGADCAATCGDSFCTHSETYATCSADCEPPNLIVNGSFEDDDDATPNRPDDWTAKKLTASDGIDCTSLASDLDCAFFFVGNGTGKKLMQTIMLSGLSGDDFVLSFDTRGEDVAGSGAYIVKVKVFYSGGDAKTFKKKVTDTGDFVWTPYTLNFSPTRNYNKIIVTIQFSKRGTVWFDDVKLLMP